MEKRISDLKNITAIQTAHGNWDYDPYMHGMANGLILALHTMTAGPDDPCKFLDAPANWLKDKGITGDPTAATQEVRPC